MTPLAVGGLLAAAAWLFGSTLKGLGAEWASSPDSSYGLVLAAVAAFVLIQRGSAIAAAADQRPPTTDQRPTTNDQRPTTNDHRPGFPAWPGALLLCAGLSCYIVGIFGADIYLTRASAVVVAAGLLQLLAGPRALRIALAPLAFLLFAIPLPAIVVNAVTLPLQLVASRIAETTLMAGGFPVYRDGNLLMLPSVTLEVADACSGLRSLVSLTAIGAVIAWADHRRLGPRIATIAAAVPVAIVMNGLRIAATGAACELWSPRAAVGGWHTFEGWITFVASVAVLMTLSALLRRRRSNAAAVVRLPQPAGAL